MNSTEQKVGFEVGDVVQLKSGGPTMTVGTKNPEETWCMWFNEKGERKSETFPNLALEKV